MYVPVLSRFPVSPSPFLGEKPIAKANQSRELPGYSFPQSIRYEYLAPSFHLVLLKNSVALPFPNATVAGSFRDSGNIVPVDSLASFPFRIKISL